MKDIVRTTVNGYQVTIRVADFAEPAGQNRLLELLLDAYEQQVLHEAEQGEVANHDET